MEEGVIRVIQSGQTMEPANSMKDYTKDLSRLEDIYSNGPCRSLTYKRLKMLEYKYGLHLILNDRREKRASKSDPKDFSTVVKVDTHVHLAAGMTAKHLLQFIQTKVRDHPDDIVAEANGKQQTLKELFDQVKLSPEHLTVNCLDVYADNTFQRFDNFNSKYNPFGFSELRNVFMKTDNFNNGKYFAEMTQELFDMLEKEEYTKTEYRVSIYGRKKAEWTALADWIEDFKLKSEVNRWIVQIPRIYEVFRKAGAVANFEILLQNIFEPLFEVTINPDSNPKLFNMLRNVSAFDSVDDESRLEGRLGPSPQLPSEWNSAVNPPYTYYMYYMYANIFALNKLRQARGLNTFVFRPHSGESGEVDHLGAAFLVAHGVNHGINLMKNTTLQYLFYLAQIGIAVSPLSNNALFLDYKRNPFPLFFKRGLNVSLSTDDPLQFHLTSSPLSEEYAIAAKRWRFVEEDKCEIARNSVLQSGFSHQQKMKWLGPKYVVEGPQGNDIGFTNVTNIRVSYRYETLREELETMKTQIQGGQDKVHPSRAIVQYPEDLLFGREEVQSAILLKEALELREKYVYVHKAVPAVNESRSNFSYRNIGGVFQVFAKADALCGNDEESLAQYRCSDCNKTFCHQCDDVIHRSSTLRSHKRERISEEEPIASIHSWETFLEDYHNLDGIRLDGKTGTYALRRLRLLELKYDIHSLLNEKFEKNAMKGSLIDWETVTKVDNHVHAASAPTADQLLHFMREKIQHHGEDVVLVQNGKDVSLEELFSRQKTTIENFTLDALDVKAVNTLHRFDKFESSYNPLGESELRTVFLKRHNVMNGRYFGELMRSVLDKRALNPKNKSEDRISIYGSKKSEWNDLADWIENFNVKSPNLKWIIQVPRIYHVFKKEGHINNFGEIIDNLFGPLFQVTRDPSSNPKLNSLLNIVSGFDSVDHEEMYEFDDKVWPAPADWNSDENPPYMYWMYYMWANIYSLNKFREEKGLATFSFRPHSGVGDLRHLSAAYLVSNGIAHGIFLAKAPVLEYLYYLSQVPITLSPLGEDALYEPYEKNPFGNFLKRGLIVSLSTDNPLQLHSTEQPLLEEYAIAAKMWNLSMCDLSEVARNSVIMSGFTREEKFEWLGKDCFSPGVSGNDPSKTNVPNVRVEFRQDCLCEEKAEVDRVGSHLGNSSSDVSNRPKGNQTPSSPRRAKHQLIQEKEKERSQQFGNDVLDSIVYSDQTPTPSPPPMASPRQEREKKHLRERIAQKIPGSPHITRRIVSQRVGVHQTQVPKEKMDPKVDDRSDSRLLYLIGGAVLGAAILSAVQSRLRGV
eukprot:TRINITY_DN9131_c0_g1_i1.p1 TRINITY_DN9131_c0_g1~~TRINITY_DN9131_c0_g1_i1.p1  ORF type:complete len:1428 (-),score=462.09 TRINITY_DN9131_c0_g1_i1:547-4461(-)